MEFRHNHLTEGVERANRSLSLDGEYFVNPTTAWHRTLF
jgi:hypothetical protein